jgi:hypothetical protein
MLSPDHNTRRALVADRQAEFRRRAETAEARRAAGRLTLTAPAEPRLFKSARLRLHRRLALARRAAHAA